jgi:hypothetical protein
MPSSARYGRALDWDALYPRRGPPGIGDLGIIGPQRTITSGQYASTQRDLDD